MEAVSAGPYMIDVEANDVSLSNFTIEGGSAGPLSPGSIVFGIRVSPGFYGFSADEIVANNCNQNGLALSGVDDNSGSNPNMISNFSGTGNLLYTIGIASSVGVTVDEVSGDNIGLYEGYGGYTQPMSDVVFTNMTLAGGFVIQKNPVALLITYTTADNTDADYNASAGVIVPAEFDHGYHASFSGVPLVPGGNVDNVYLVQEAFIPTAINLTQNGPYPVDDEAVRDLSLGQWEVSQSAAAPVYALTIQEAVDIAASGDVIAVFEGTYDDSVTINKALTLIGPNAGIACGSRVAEAILAPTAGTPVTITADGVSLNGFEITAPDAYYAVNLGSTSNTTVSFNNIHDIGTTPTGGGNVHAIVYSVGSSNSTTVAITDNCLNNISSSALSGFSASAIGILQSTSTGVLDGISIMRNAISNVNVNTGTWPTGKIAYGIQINVAGGSGFASSTGNAKNAVVSFNTITDVEGYIATGIALEGNTEDAIIIRNEVTNLTAYKLANRAGGGFDLNGLKFENNKYVGTVTVENNSFDASTFTHNGTPGLGYAVANYVLEADGGVASLSCNWYGSADYGELVVDYNAAPAPTGKIFNKDGAGTSFISYLTNSTIDSGAGGYSCSGAHATATSLNVAYTAASENIVVTFNVANNSVAEYPIPGLNPTVPADQIEIANKYVALQTALLTGTPAQVEAAALDLGDDIITEYFYMDGVNEVYLQTAGASDLIKNKYWDQYLNNSTTSTAYPNFGTNLFVVPTGPYSTSTNPLTGTVASDWLSPVYGKDLHVRVTVIHNGNVDIKTETVAIGLGPVRVYSDLAETTLVSSHISIQAAIDAATTMDGYVVRVDPGTYVEDIVVNKPLTIRGPNADNCANGARVDEAIIHPHTSTPFGKIIKVQASNVTVEGF